MAIPTPLVLTDLGIALGDGAATEVFSDVSCSGNHLEISPDTAVTEVESFCGSVDIPGLTKWSLVLTFNQSLDSGAIEDVLSAIVDANIPVGFQVLGYKSQPVGATNPMWTGKVRPAPYSPVSGDAGDTSTIELEWGIVEGPNKTITGTFPTGAMPLAESASKSSK